MTDEELQQEIQNLTESIDKLPDDPPTRQERRHRYNLLLKREILQKIKQAREKNDRRQELKSSTEYALLKSFGERHPLLLHLASIRFRGDIFS